MGAVTMTIDGTSVMPYVRAGSLTIQHFINARPVCSFELNTKFTSDSYRPVLGKTIVVTDGGTRVFGGPLYTMAERAVIHNKARNVHVDGVGYEFFADRGLINGITTGNLKAQMSIIVGNIGHGVVVDAGQANGPSVPDQGFPFLTCRAALDQLSVVTGYIYRFDHFGNVLMFLPGSLGAPFSLIDTNSTMTKLTVQQTLSDYINSIWIQFGSPGNQQVTSTVNGDGSTRLFPLGYTVATPPSTVTVTISGVPTVYPVGIYGVDSAPTFVYFYRQVDPTYPYSIIQDTSQPVLGVSDTLVATFSAQFPGAIQVNNNTEIAANGPFAKVMSAPNVYDRVVATAIAQGELDRLDSQIRTVTVETMQPGLEPGMTVNITSSPRNVSGVNFLITSVKMTHVATKRDGTQIFKYEVSGVEGNRYQPWASWAQYFRTLGGTSTNAGASSVSSGGTVVSTTLVPIAFWGGSRSQGVFANGVWRDVPNWMPVRITGNGQPVNVRAFQATDNSGTSVQTRIVKRVSGVDTQMATAATTTNARAQYGENFSEQLMTFTPDNGVNDYILQIKGGGNDMVYGIATSV